MAHKDKREMLLDAAVDLFYQKGYADTSIRDIGAKSGVNPSIIYHYFKNKEQLLFEIVRNTSDDICKMLLQIEKEVLGPVECLREMLNQNMVFFLNRKKEVKIVAYDRYYLSGKRREIERKMQREIYDIYMNKLQMISEKGLLNNVDIRVMNFCISSIVIGFRNWFREDGPLSADEVIKNIINFVLNAIFKDLEQEYDH